MYDIIGDIHGHADELVELLTKLGYADVGGCFRHPQRRKAIFCGDFIDRGPNIPDVVRIAKSMVQNDAALAVMGNHEFNALAYHSKDPACPENYLRPHNKKNEQQHSQTQQQFDADELQAALDWFATLPAALDLGQLRIVHACWNDSDIQTIAAGALKYGAFSPSFLKLATTKGSSLFQSIERVMKGPELPLPEGVTVTDKEGNIRKRIRIRWFSLPGSIHGRPIQLNSRPPV